MCVILEHWFEMSSVRFSIHHAFISHNSGSYFYWVPLHVISGKRNASTILFSFIHFLPHVFSIYIYIYIIWDTPRNYKCSSRSFFFSHIAGKTLIFVPPLSHLSQFIPYSITFTTFRLNKFRFIFVISCRARMARTTRWK